MQVPPRPTPPESVQLELDRQSKTPFYRQIYERLAGAISRGVLRPGERLPSSRSLASQLSTSRGTIDLAYSLLSSDGYIHTQGAAGTVVAERPAAHAKAPEPSPDRQRTEQFHANFSIKPFLMGQPALDVFPRKLWTRLSVKHARQWNIPAMAAPDPLGYAPLRKAVASYLAVSRGVLCSPSQVIITSGFQSSLGLLTRALLSPGDAIWLEDPGYFMVRIAFEMAGGKVTGVPVDAEGLNVRAGIKRAPRARFAYVTPSHQAPLGVSLSVERRSALLDWAARAGAWILEDDYDGEFRYGSRPLPALKSLDHAGRVIYIGSFSKVLFPGIRLSYLVVPDSCFPAINRVCQVLYRDRAVLNQATVAEFLAEGHFARHIKRMRKLYADRREALARGLADAFGKRIDLQLEAGGMHLLARFAECKSDREWAARATAHGLAPAPLSEWNVQGECGQGLLLSFTNIPAHEARGVAVRLRKAIDAGPR